jgi:hypothetical protein
MNCPKCVGKLQEKELNGIKVDVCYICEGIWFDKGELEELIKLDSQDWQLDTLGQDDYDGAEVQSADIELDKTPGKCPRCEDGTMLNRSQTGLAMKKVYVDVCPHKHGVWLDGGEIHLFRQRKFADLRESLAAWLRDVKIRMEFFSNKRTF